jgi:hypothetical protein
MAKILFFILAAVAGWLLVKGLTGKRFDRERDENPAGSSPEKMLKCDRCGVFIPVSESMSLDGRLTCRTPDRCPKRQNA